MRLLIVDDHPVNLKLLRAQLESDAHSVLEAANGVEALRIMERERVDGVISDILMPEMDGFRLCLEVRRSRDFAELPFIFYTATYNSPQDRELARSVGGDGYLLKPSPANIIVDAIRSAAAKSRPAAERDAPRYAEPDVLKRYSAALVEKLEQKNLQLDDALQQLQQANDELRHAEERYRAVFENAAVGISHGHPDGELLLANPKYCEIYGYTQEEILGLDIRRLTYPDDLVQVLAQRKRLLDGETSAFRLEVRFVRKDGSLVWVDLSTSLVRGPDGRPLHFISVLQDVTERIERDRRIARLNRVKSMKSRISSTIVRTRDRQTLLNEACAIAVQEGGLRAAWVGWHDAATRSVRPLASAGALEGFLEEMDLSIDTSQGELAGAASVRALQTGRVQINNDVRVEGIHQYREQALRRGFVAMMQLPLLVGGVPQAVLVLYASEPGYFDAEEVGLLQELAADVSFALESIRKSERLDYLANYDPLTGLPNRRLFQDRLSRSLRRRGGEPALVAVALFDLERFRRLNESIGREASDELLRDVGARLQRANDTAARIGVDLYAITLRGARSAEEVNRGISAIVAACFSEPFAPGGQELRVASRIGIALHPTDGADAETLLRNAEAALHRSKRNGERVLFYAREMNARVAEAVATENKLRRAIERQEFVLHYQPKVRLADGRITGVEALIRWQDPEGGLVPPGRFVPVLEETGLIGEVGRWALERALTDIAAWRSRGLAIPRVAVNVSALQLQRRDFPDMVIDAVQRSGDRPELLDLEVTESLFMRDVEDSTRKLRVLRGKGVAVSMDDFGTGYSSLSYLARLPIDAVKIDRSFVAGIPGGAEDVTIVAGIVALVRSLKLRVIAEGVETAEQAAHLAALGCDEAQGYYYSRPVPAERLVEIAQAGNFRP